MNEDLIRAEARRDAFNEAASVDAQVIAMLLTTGKISQADVDEALLKVKIMRSQQSPAAVETTTEAPLPAKVAGRVRILHDPQEICIRLHSGGWAMKAPTDGRRAELVRIGESIDDQPRYVVTAVIYEQTVRMIESLRFASPLVHVAVKEPGQDAVWVVVSASNTTALQYICDPALVPDSPDDTDEGDFDD